MKARGRGFSLIELMFAIGILFLCSVFIMQLFIVSSRYSTKAYERSNASLLAQSKMESTLPLSALPAEREGVFDKPFDDYHFTVEMTPYKSLGRVVRVTVTSPSGLKSSVAVVR